MGVVVIGLAILWLYYGWAAPIAAVLMGTGGEMAHLLEVHWKDGHR
jgi:hypothetical protein